MSYECNALIAGGNWNNGASCSSRCRNANNVRSNANANIGSREAIWGETPAEFITLAKAGAFI